MQDSSDHSRNESRPAQRRGGYAEWIALGAIAAGSVGAVVGMTKCRTVNRETTGEASDPETVTAPHGDKLKGAVV